jgi:hypothetical protein
MTLRECNYVQHDSVVPTRSMKSHVILNEVKDLAEMAMTTRFHRGYGASILGSPRGYPILGSLMENGNEDQPFT